MYISPPKCAGKLTNDARQATSEDFIAIRSNALSIFGENPRKTKELISELTEQGHAIEITKDTVWWMIDDEYLSLTEAGSRQLFLAIRKAVLRAIEHRRA